MIGFEREDDEIVRYYEKVQPGDIFGVWGTELMLRLPLRKAEKFMKKDHGWTPEAWEKSMLKKDHESVLAEMEDYFQFAWEKSVGHRGLSASRSVQHYLAWFWLMNDMELMGFAMDARNYPNYGAPVLLEMAKKYEMLDLMPTNNTDRYVLLNMAKGQPCIPNCTAGCGVGAPMELRPLPAILPTKLSIITPK